METYIFGKRNLIHIIDIRETVKGLLRAKKYLAQVIARGEDVLFVGTKRQARHSIFEQSERCGMPYVNNRWLGGTLTNFRTIRSRLTRLEELEAVEADGRLQEYSKKAISMHNREIRKIKSNLEGIRRMNKMPGALLIIDSRREHLAVREAKKLGIPTICLIDTDSDPDFADIPIPGNDDSMRSIEVILMHLTDAIEEGKKGRRVEAKDDGKSGDIKRRSQRPTTGSAEEPAGQTPAMADTGSESNVAVLEAKPETAPTPTPAPAPEEPKVPTDSSDSV